MIRNEFLDRYRKWGFEQTPITLPVVIRLNTLAGTATFDKNIKIEHIPFLNHGYVFHTNFSPSSTPSYLLGQIYVQEAASQLVSQIAQPQEGQTIIDLCAAPGSKTTHLAQLMNNTGKIFAVDIDANRLKKLEFNLERCKVTNTYVIKDDSASVKLPPADIVLVDAPCSGNFVIDAEWFEKRTLAGIRQQAVLQRKILQNATRLVKNTGKILYTTCSLEIEENEEVIEWFLERNPAFELIPIECTIGNSGLTEKTRVCKRFWPSITHTQGFFIAVLAQRQQHQ